MLSCFDSSLTHGDFTTARDSFHENIVNHFWHDVLGSYTHTHIDAPFLHQQNMTRCTWKISTFLRTRAMSLIMPDPITLLYPTLTLPKHTFLC